MTILVGNVPKTSTAETCRRLEVTYDRPLLQTLSKPKKRAFPFDTQRPEK